MINEDIETLETLGINSTSNHLEFDKKYLNKTLQHKHGSHSYVGRGLYSLQIKAWFSVFPRENFHFLLLENLNTKYQFDSEMSRLFDFLDAGNEVDGIPVQVTDSRIRNGRQYEKMDTELEKKLRAFYQPFNDDLEELLGIDLKSWA